MTETPNSHDLTSANPAFAYYSAALADLDLTDDDVFPNRAPANRARIGVGRFPVLDNVMARATELYEAAR